MVHDATGLNMVGSDRSNCKKKKKRICANSRNQEAVFGNCTDNDNEDL